MTPTRRTNLLSGVVAGLGVLTVAFLEMAYTPGDMTEFQIWSTRGAILIGGLLRWYMFYEGTALGAFNQNDARIALRMSITLAVMIFAYGVFLALYGAFDWHLFGLFSVVNLGLVFAEWVFGRRTSYVKPEIQIRLESELEAATEELTETRDKLEKRNAELNAVRVRQDDLQQQITTLEHDLTTHKARLSELTELVADHDGELERLRVYEQAVTGCLIQEPDGTKFAVCSCGNRVDMHSNNTKILTCDCGQVVYQKK